MQDIYHEITDLEFTMICRRIFAGTALLWSCGRICMVQEHNYQHRVKGLNELARTQLDRKTKYELPGNSYHCSKYQNSALRKRAV